MTDLMSFQDFTNAQSVLEVSRDAVFKIADERIVYTNKYAVQILGFKEPSEIIGRWACEFVSPDQKRAKIRTTNSNSPFRYEMTFRRSDGSIIYVETQLTIIEYEGRPASLFFFRDISQRKQFEIKIEALHDHALEINKMKTVEEITNSTLTILRNTFGYDHVEIGLIEDGFITIISENSVSRIARTSLKETDLLLCTIRDKKTNVSMETQKENQHKSPYSDEKNNFTSEIYVPVIVNEKVFSIIMVKSDTETTFNESDKKLIEILAQHIASSIAIIYERQKLNQSLNDLENLNQELNIYNYAVSHDLKAPLQIISLSSELLKKSSFDKLTDREKADLSQISQSIKNMKKLIDELLMLSQIDKAQKKITLVNINEVIAEIQEEVKAAETTNVPKFVFHNLPVVTCQRTLIKQLFLNLIANGIKYNRSDEPTIWINYEDHYDYHQFSVKDNGIGINADNYGRVFEPFKRLHPREEFPGTGVGLVICKKIIETFHGKIWLESKPDIGSTFFITIPKKLIQGEDRGDLLNPDSATEGSDP